MRASTAIRLGGFTAATCALLAALPGQSFAQRVPARASACTVRDGTARTGQSVGSNPVRFAYAATPYLGARFDSCKGYVAVPYGYFGDRAPFSTHYNIAWGQRTGIEPVFSHQRELPVIRRGQPEPFRLAWNFYTHETDVAPVSAFFRIQRCLKPGGLFRTSQCGPWGPTVTVSLEGNALNG